MIVQFDIDAGIIRPTLEDSRDASATIRRITASEDVDLQGFFQVASEDFDEFDHHLAADPTVAEFSEYSSSGDRKQYSIHFSETLSDIDAYNALVSHDGVVLQCESRESVWSVKSRFPSRERYRRFLETARDFDFDIQTVSIYGDSVTTEGRELGLTEPQREALLVAKEMGYFSFPQQSTLNEISDVLGISRTAVSGRLHRGLDRLVANTMETGMPGEYVDEQG